MENIYTPRVNKIVKIKEFRESFKFNDFLPNDMSTLTDVDIKVASNFEGTQTEYNDLLESINLNVHLSHPDDVNVSPFDPSAFAYTKRTAIVIPKDALKLNCVRQRIEQKKIRNYRTNSNKYTKYKYIQPLISNQSYTDLVPMQENIITIRLYQPFKFDPKSNRVQPKFSQEYQVLGSQKLTELRDKICCSCKFGSLFDISNDISQNLTEIKDNSGFFFISDIFYNDFRDENSIDYSSVIREWSKEQPSIGELKTAIMAKTTFNDLTVRLGYPQVYQHYGNCEHLFTFSDIRLLSPTDSLVRNHYPMLKQVSNNKAVSCYICGHWEAQIVVRKSKEHITDPTFMCQQCFESYHYVDNKKVGTFEAFRFHGNKVIGEIPPQPTCVDTDD